ncbi:MAG: hypothetical protein ACLP5V_00970 [Candidatus Bathyarchaeia archaeon]
MSSILSMNVKRLGQILKEGAEGQVGESRVRLEGASSTYWPLMSKLLISDFRYDRSYETAQDIFKKPSARFAAVDGSMDQSLLGGLAVFWAGAYAATGTITYTKDQSPRVTYDSHFVEKGHGLASCVPIYIDSIPDVEPQSESGGQAISGPLTDQSTVDNSTIANWIMLFSELYLAYTMAKTKEFQSILLDRSLSGTHSSLLHDTSKRALWKRECATLRITTDGLGLDEQDLAYSRYRTRDGNGLLPPRGDYLRHSAMFLMEQFKMGPLSVDELAGRLNIKSDSLRVEKLARYLTKAAKEGMYFREVDGKFSLMPNLLTAWDRTQRMVEFIGQRLFASNVGNPLRINDGRESRWLTTLDLAFLCLFTLNMLIETCRLNKVLLIGITKDTTARDMITHLIPLCVERHIWAGNSEQVATTDRMLLQALSMFHHDQVQVPWATVEYDTSFQTIVGRFNDVKGDISGAVKNRVIQEQLFVKSYIQLDKAKSDDQFRSNVLFIDRLYLPSEKAPTLILKHEYGGAVEEVRPILWQEASAQNRIQELMMVTLKAMTHESVPEVFGHNEPLYIADKIAKAQQSNASQMIRGMGHWLISHPKLRKYSFYMNTFRSRRSEIENARNRT